MVGENMRPRPSWDEKHAFMDDVEKFSPNDNMPIIALGAAFYDGPDMTESLLRSAAKGRDGITSNDSLVDFPNELAIEYGGPEERFGYIEMGNLSFGHEESISQVPFPIAMKMFEVLAKHYLAYRPDRTERVNDLLAQARVTLARMQDEHEAWKRQNGADDS